MLSPTHSYATGQRPDTVDLDLLARFAVAVVTRATEAARRENPAPDLPSAARLWRPLSPQSLRVVRLLAGEGWLTREEIADRLGESPEGDIRPLLSDLAKRGILESSGRKGYHVTLPDDVDPEQARRELLAWARDQDDATERKASRPTASKPRSTIPLPATLPHDDAEEGERLTDEQLDQRIAAAKAQRNGTSH